MATAMDYDYPASCDCYTCPGEDCLPDLPDTLVKEIFSYWEPSSHTTSDTFKCLYSYWAYLEHYILSNKNTTYTYQDLADTHCLPHWDGVSCWGPAVEFGKSLTLPCPDRAGFHPGKNITVMCGLDGNFGSADYSKCLTEDGRHAVMCSNSTLENPILGCQSNMDEMFLVLRDIYFFGSIASLVLLTIALFIFCIFKSLQCPRVNIHKNLLISLMIQCIIHIVMFEPYIGVTTTTSEAEQEKELRTTYNDIIWLCKLLFTLKNYVCMTNVAWAFVEGLFLYSRISIAVFSTDTPYWLFYAIGWGIPAIFTGAWAICMHIYHPEHQCWKQMALSEQPYFYIIIAPILLAVAANIVFLICIIRILITKLHAVHSAEHIQIRKAMKATVVLLPLLSITSVFFLWGPDMHMSPAGYIAYRIINACLQVSQGIFVSVLFCYFNGEVRSALLKYFKKWQTGAFRYRTSRASSVCVTQSETVLCKGISSSSIALWNFESSRVKPFCHLMPTGSHRRQSYSSHQSTDLMTTANTSV